MPKPLKRTNCKIPGLTNGEKQSDRLGGHRNATRGRGYTPQSKRVNGRTLWNGQNTQEKHRQKDRDQKHRNQKGNEDNGQEKSPEFRRNHGPHIRTERVTQMLTPGL